MPNIVTLSILWQKGKLYGCSSGYIDSYFDRETEEREQQKERERERERERKSERKKWIRNLHVYFVSYVPDCIYAHVCLKLLQIYQLESLQGRSYTPILSL
jgi:hypothetical protein